MHLLAFLHLGYRASFSESNAISITIWYECIVTEVSRFLFQVQTELKRRLWTWQIQTHLSPSKKHRVTVTQIMMHDSTHSQTAVCNGYITSVWHTWMMPVERLAEDFRSFTSGSGVWKTFKEEDMGHCTALPRSCFKYLRVLDLADVIWVQLACADLQVADLQADCDTASISVWRFD